MRKLFFITIGILSLVLIMIVTLFVAKTTALRNELEQLRQLETKWEAKINEATVEKGRLKARMEKLQNDALSYIQLNNKLTRENEELKRQLNQKAAALKENEQELERLRKTLKDLRAKGDMEILLAQERQQWQKEKDILQEKIKAAEEAVKQTKTLYYYNMGVLYTEIGRQQEALKSFQKALEIDPNNADAHYNIGILYKNYFRNKPAGDVHLRRYLELLPQAPDRPEVERMLKE